MRGSKRLSTKSTKSYDLDEPAPPSYDELVWCEVTDEASLKRLLDEGRLHFTQAEIAFIKGVSRARVQQLETRAIRKIRKALAKKGELKGFDGEVLLSSDPIVRFR